MRLALARTLLQLGFRQLDFERSFIGVDFDHVTVAQEPDRPAERRLRPDMADTETTGSPGKTAVSDQGDLVAHALAV